MSIILLEMNVKRIICSFQSNGWLAIPWTSWHFLLTFSMNFPSSKRNYGEKTGENCKDVEYYVVNESFTLLCDSFHLYCHSYLIFHLKIIHWNLSSRFQRRHTFTLLTWIILIFSFFVMLQITIKFKLVVSVVQRRFARIL